MATTHIPQQTDATELARQATRAAEFRGHRMGAWLWRTYGHARVGNSICLDCGREAHVTTRPAPNDIAVGGEVVALGCVTTPPKTL